MATLLPTQGIGLYASQVLPTHKLAISPENFVQIGPFIQKLFTTRGPQQKRKNACRSPTIFAVLSKCLYSKLRTSKYYTLMFQVT